ncbi:MULTISPECIES: hypothetical protein [unclassified Corynebacterium]|nr:MULTISPECIES: hypothetical protein [unclassified Corynebacterium]MCG7290385.1 hypothetical protein [Corynebacterium sp. ACRPZ]MCG7294620.1 hypothetical protein [Corynebacterium sp. ACRPY]
MAQEQFAGPEHYTDFDPEKFIRDMKIMAEEEEKDGESGDEGSAVDASE